MIMEEAFRLLSKKYVFLYSKVHHIGDLFFYKLSKKLGIIMDHVQLLIMFEYLTVYPMATSKAEILLSTNMGAVHMRLCRLIYTGNHHFNRRVLIRIFLHKSMMG